MYTVLHNSRCGKSREAVKFFEEEQIDFKVREYLKEELSFDELKLIVEQLGVKPIEIVRTNEAIWKEEFKGKDFSDDELIQLMIDNPKLIQRPLVLKDGKGVIGRPFENIQEFVQK